MLLAVTQKILGNHRMTLVHIGIYFTFIIGMLVLGLTFLDYALAEYFFTQVKSCNTDVQVSPLYQFFSVLSVLAEPQYPLILCASWWVYGMVRQHDRIRFEGRFSFSCLAMTAVLVPVFKLLFKRSRPVLFVCEHVHAFHVGLPFFTKLAHRYTSFPSGHAVTAFTFLSVISLLYPKNRFLAGILACACAISRLIVSAHYFTDVFVGATFGYWFVQVVYQWYYVRKHMQLFVQQHGQHL